MSSSFVLTHCLLSGDGGWLCCKGGVRLRSGSFLLKFRKEKH